MNILLSEIVSDLADALAVVDSERPQCKSYRPGIGPHGEDVIVKKCVEHLATEKPAIYGEARKKRYPNSTKQCDLYIPDQWAIEFKLLRPFGDNEKEAEHWSENILHPYSGDTSAVSDCFKLIGSSFECRRGIIVLTFEHTPPQIDCEVSVRCFELIAREVLNIPLGRRHESAAFGLIHPCHQQARIYAWEVGAIAD